MSTSGKNTTGLTDEEKRELKEREASPSGHQDLDGNPITFGGDARILEENEASA